MEIVETMPYEILRAMPAPVRATARVTVRRGHEGPKHPYSIPFNLTIEAPGHPVWWARLNFDLLYVETPYGAPNLLARHLSMLRRIAEDRTTHDDAEIDPAIWHAVAAISYDPDDPYLFNGHADLQSRRTEFTRKSFAQLVEGDPREFHIYRILTITGANSRRSNDRDEFRIVSRPEAPHKWLFWTHAPNRVDEDPAEIAFWFKQHIAQLRGPRRPRWTPIQKDRWFAAVHRELTGKTAAEMSFDALAAPMDEKPPLALILGGEESSAGVKQWLVPRMAFTESTARGVELEGAFIDARDRHRKTIRLIFQSITMLRTALEEIATGQRRRLGIGKELRAIVGESPGQEFTILVGLTAVEEDPYISAFVEQYGNDGRQYRSGLSLMLIEPDRPKTEA